MAFHRALESGSILTSAACIGELNDVLSRAKFSRYVDPDQRQRFLAAFIREARLVDIRESVELRTALSVDEAAVRREVGRAKALGDAIDAEREAREARLRDAGFEEPGEEQRRANLATNVALMEWPRG